MNKTTQIPVKKMLKNFYLFKGWKNKKLSTKIMWVCKIPLSAFIIPLLIGYVVYTDLRYYMAIKSVKSRMKEFIKKVVD